MTPPGIAIIHMEKSSILNMPNKHPPKPKSLYHYLSPDIKKSLTPEAIKLSKRTMVQTDTNFFAGGGYNINKKTVTLKNTIGTVPTHEFMHVMDFNSGLSKDMKLSARDTERMFKKYWSKRPPVPLVMQTGNYYPPGQTSDRRLEYYRQSVEGQPKIEQFATMGQNGARFVPHYLRRLYSAAYKFPKLPRVLFTGD